MNNSEQKIDPADLDTLRKLWYMLWIEHLSGNNLNIYNSNTQSSE